MIAGPELVAESCGADVVGSCADVVEECSHEPGFIELGVCGEIPGREAFLSDGAAVGVDSEGVGVCLGGELGFDVGVDA